MQRQSLGDLECSTRTRIGLAQMALCLQNLERRIGRKPICMMPVATDLPGLACSTTPKHSLCSVAFKSATWNKARKCDCRRVKFAALAADASGRFCNGKTLIHLQCVTASIQARIFVRAGACQSPSGWLRNRHLHERLDQILDRPCPGSSPALG